MARRSDDDSDLSISTKLMSQFIDVYEAAAEYSEKDFKQLFNRVKGYEYSTLFGQLTHLVKGVIGEDGKLSDLFVGDPPESGLKPTSTADFLYTKFVALVEAQKKLREQVARIRSYQPPTCLRAGSSQVIGIRLLSYLLSVWDQAFPDIHLQLDIGPTNALIPKLAVGLLDCVVAYGPIDGHYENDNVEVVFDSLGYRSRMVLLAPPRKPLWTHDGRNLNERDYWAKFLSRTPTIPADNRAAAKRVSGKRPKGGSTSAPGPPALGGRIRYEDLRPVQLTDIDFGRSGLELFIVPSWQQPAPLAEREGRKPNYKTVKTYEDALAIVRLGGGVTAAPEVFCRRRFITAFQLTPTEKFTRWIGLYRGKRFRSSELAAGLGAFLQCCFTNPRIKSLIQQGQPPAFADGEYATWSKELSGTDAFRSAQAVLERDG